MPSLLPLVACCLLLVAGSPCNAADAMTIDAGSGNVGIGTEAPAEKLHVAGNLHVDGDLQVDGAIVNPQLPGTSLVSAYRADDLTDLGADTDHDLMFDTQQWDVLGEFDPATGVYTAATAKKVTVRVLIFGDTMTSGKKEFIAKIQVDTGAGYVAAAISETVASGGKDTIALAKTLDLPAGAKVKVSIASDSGGFAVRGGPARNGVQITRN